MATTFLTAKNLAEATLAEALDATETLIDIDAGDDLPTTYPFHVCIGDEATGDFEVLKVNSRATNTLTVVRGQDGTSGTTHTTGDSVQTRVTAGYISEIQTAVSAIEGWDTDDLNEGAANLYYTAERAQDDVGGIFTDSSSIDFTYDDATPSITGVIPDYYRKADSPPSPLPWRFIIDEGTTNLLPDTDDSRFATSLGTWTEYEPSGNVTLTRETTTTLIGAGRGHVVHNTATANIGVRCGAVSISASDKVAGTIWLRGAVGGENIHVQLVGDVSGATNSGLLGVQLTTGWTKTKVYKPMGGTDTTVYFRILTNGAATPTYDIGAAQIEINDSGRGTTYSDPTLGRGYSSMTRSAGIHFLGTIDENAGMPFAIGSDGAILSSDTLTFRGERLIEQGVASSDQHFLFEGAAITNTLTWGDETGVVKVRNLVNGNVLYLDCDNVTTRMGLLISAASLTSGYALAIGAPANLENFTGEYFGFFSKQPLQQWAWSKLRQKTGDPNDVLQKWFQTYGGGKWSSATTTMTGLASTAQASPTVTGDGACLFLSEYAVGDIIKIGARSLRITAIATNTSLTVAGNWGANNTTQAHARHDDQYKPAMYLAERSTSSLTDGTSDHASLTTRAAAPFSALLVGETGRWYTYRGTVDNTVPAPTADSDSDPLISVLARDYTQTLVNSTTEAAIVSETIPGGLLGTGVTGGSVRCDILGNIRRNAGHTFVIRVKYGATTLITTGAITNTNSATNEPFFIRVILGNDTTSVQKARLEFGTTVAIASTPTNRVLGYGTSAIDSSADQTLQITIDWSGTSSANSRFESEGYTLEVV